MGRKLSRRKLRGPRRRCRPSEIPKINMLRKSILRALRIQLRTNHNNNNAHVRTRAAPSLSLSLSLSHPVARTPSISIALSLSLACESPFGPVSLTAISFVRWPPTRKLKRRAAQFPQLKSPSRTVFPSVLNEEQ